MILETFYSGLIGFGGLFEMFLLPIFGLTMFGPFGEIC